MILSPSNIQQTPSIVDHELAIDMADNVYAGFQTPSQYAKMLIVLGVNPVAISEGIKFALKAQFKYSH